ncbi:suppressor of fused domain protein [Buchananella hordeovulneris]|uniref:suppressor of fused domain protein n=1 Tax=Buchananella hordeovulneris TaxID=52770 RepID=UPI000F5F8F27|nr:suppressor of fused domain protein [Buchananella hordeovulneris]RRD42723.1 suppressor of fused domain protein [Buchananella hordeovulneris]
MGKYGNRFDQDSNADNNPAPALPAAADTDTGQELELDADNLEEISAMLSQFGIDLDALNADDEDDTEDDEDDADADSAPGWDAINAACDVVYPDQPNPPQLATIVKWAAGGNDPLDGVSIYRALEPVPHWHYVSYGMSDLYGAQDGPDEYGESGWGFEFTFRLADPAAATADPASAPTWPVSMMQNLARYVFGTGNVFAAGHHMDLQGKIALEEETDLRAIGFVVDPDLGTIDTPSGQVAFLQILGLTLEDLTDTKTWRSAKFFELLMERYPRGVTFLDRASLRSEPALAARIDAGRAADGSGMGQTFVSELAGRRAADGVHEVEIGALIVRELPLALSSRLPFGNDFLLRGPEHAVLFQPGPQWQVEQTTGQTTLTLTPTDQEALLAHLQPVAGTYQWRDDFRIVVTVSKITNSAGDVVETVG